MEQLRRNVVALVMDAVEAVEHGLPVLRRQPRLHFLSKQVHRRSSHASLGTGAECQPRLVRLSNAFPRIVGGETEKLLPEDLQFGHREQIFVKVRVLTGARKGKGREKEGKRREEEAEQCLLTTSCWPKTAQRLIQT